MAGTYTQNGSALSLQVTQNAARAAGQTLAMPGTTLHGTISPDGNMIDVGSGPIRYQLRRS